METAPTDPADDDPLTLADACRIIFKGAITPASLRAEAARGRLIVERIGRKDFVTRAAIREMRKQCELVPPQKAPGYGSSRSVNVPADAQHRPIGPSATTADTSVALTSALMTVRALRERSPNTSRKNTRSFPVNVIPLKG